MSAHGGTLYTKTCPCCSRLFQTTKKKQVHCSKQCRPYKTPRELRPFRRKMRNTYAHMMRRCNDPTNRAYKWYGARGITVCQEWTEDFQKFFDWSISTYESGHTLDRINNNGPYSPTNCHWATITEQIINRRITHWITAWGETKCLKAWVIDQRAKYTGKNLLARLRAGLKPEDAISGPRRKPSGRPPRAKG